MKTKIVINISVLLFAFMMVVISCRKKHPNEFYYDRVTCNEPDDTLNIYSLKISSVFNTSCVRSGCHDSGSHKKGVNLEGYDNSVSTFNSKPVLCAIYQDKGCKSMPRNSSRLPDAVLHDITCWAKNNYPY